MTTTLGQLLINQALPEDLRDYTKTWDKVNTIAALREVARKYPEQYKDILQKLMMVGQSSSTSGNFSYSLKDFSPTAYKKKTKAELQRSIGLILANPKLTPKQRDDKVIDLLRSKTEDTIKGTLDESRKLGNRLADVVYSGSKGTPSQFNTTVGIPLLYTDHKGEAIPIPVLNSVAEGFDPAEYWASTYGTRFGVISTKFATQDAGHFGKQLARTAHRLVITEEDCGTDNGISVDGGDKENLGAVLAANIGNLKAGHVIGVEDLPKLKDKKIRVRSPITCQAENGLCAQCSGVRETGSFPDIGDNIGVPATQALSERLSQGMLNVKHTGGVVGKKKTFGFEDIDRLFNMPKHFPGSAAVVRNDGIIKSIEPATTGGYHIAVGDDEYWAPSLEDVTVKVGDTVEAGDIISEGIVNPKDLAETRGIGDARRYFVDEMRRVTGGEPNRRNAEVISRAIIKHIKVDSMYGPDGTIIGDSLPYDNIVRQYEPREDAKEVHISSAKGSYLEKPILHYTIGTKISNRMINDLKSNGITSILVHKDAPEFTPDVEGMNGQSQLDPDWMVRMGGDKLKTSLLKGVHRGSTSDEHSTSYVPALAKGTEFGKDIKEKGLY